MSHHVPPEDVGKSGSSRLRSPIPPLTDPLSGRHTISVDDVLKLLPSSSQSLILDTRPLGLFLGSHFPCSANISIPSLIFKRFRKSSGPKVTTWDGLAGFVSTPAGKDLWVGLDTTKWVDVVILGLTAEDELASTLRGFVEGLVEKGSVKVLQGGWAAVLASSAAQRELVSYEIGDDRGATTSAQPGSAPPPLIPSSLESPPRFSHHPSMPSLRPDSPRAQRTLPPSSAQGGASSRRPPKLSLNLDKPLRSATLPPESLNLNKKSSMLSINMDGFNHLSPGLPKSPLSFQTLCLAQSKLPPSPSSFGDVKRFMGPDEDMVTQSPSNSAHPDGLFLAASSIGNPPPTAGLATARNGMAPFQVSTVLPSFLFLGPEITSRDDIDVLKRLGVKRILNVALECNDDEGLMLRDNFERYVRVPMRDIVEETGVAKCMRDACDFLGEFTSHGFALMTRRCAPAFGPDLRPLQSW